MMPNKVDYKSLPMQPGVYLFKDSIGKIIYVGKAKQLKKRVSSYFQKSDKSPKTQVMVQHITALDHIITRSEVEALLLENKLIKQHKPKYNISLKDAKTYAYLKITGDRYPKVITARKVTKEGEYFGPYTDGFARVQVQRLMSRIFKLRTCKKLPKRECLNYHLGLCSAPCIDNVSKEEYATQVAGARKFLRGERKEIIAKLLREMKESSKKQEYEIALERREQLSAIEHLEERQVVDLIKSINQDVVVMRDDGNKAAFALMSIKKGVILGKQQFLFESGEEIFESFLKQYYTTRALPNEIIVNTKFWLSGSDLVVLEDYFSQVKGSRVTITLPKRGEKHKIMGLAEKNLHIENPALSDLKELLNLAVVPRIIECFDISNLGPTELVSGMTRFIDGQPDESGYRRFKIKSVIGKNDDFASMKEVVGRRYKRLSEEHSQMPDLVLIDGGLGQLGAARDAMKKIGVKLPVISLAKQEEELFIPGSNESIKEDKNSQVMLLLRRIRDATHRLAISYNRKRRQMALRDDT